MTATQPDSDGTATQADHGLTRRGVMRKTAVGIGAAATVGGGAMTLENGPVQESEAVAPIFVAGAIGAGITARWALDQAYDVFGANTSAEGLTAGALRQDVFQTTLTRESTNSSTIVDNQNLLDGIEHTAYTDGKVAAIEKLNAGESESEVLSAADSSIESYHRTIQKNLLETWNESVREFRLSATAIADHPEVSLMDMFEGTAEEMDRSFEYVTVDSSDIIQTLADGTDFTVEQVNLQESNQAYEVIWSPLGFVETHPNDNFFDNAIKATADDGSTVTYLRHSTWEAIWNDVETTFQNVSDGISTWVTNVYGSVQSGEIEISELVTPRERAAMMADDESISQALADLIALNIPVDLEREATIHIAETGTTLRGSFALTNEADGPIESGATYDPATFAGSAYFTTDISLLEGTWSAFETGVDGGTITLTSEPYEGMVYSVETTAGETVSVPASDWVDSGTGTWTYDASASLETSITEVASVEYFAETDETQFETIGLDSPFTVERLENTNTGEEETSASFSSTEPQDDTNYITQEEWDELEQQNQELIEKYEESQNSGGGGGGLLGDSLGGDIQTLGIVAGGAALAALLFGNN